MQGGTIVDRIGLGLSDFFDESMVCVPRLSWVMFRSEKVQIRTPRTQIKKIKNHCLITFRTLSDLEKDDNINTQGDKSSKSRGSKREVASHLNLLPDFVQLIERDQNAFRPSLTPSEIVQLHSPSVSPQFDPSKRHFGEVHETTIASTQVAGFKSTGRN